MLGGSGDSVDISDRSAVDFTANFSLEAWFNPTTAGTRVIIGKESSYLLAYRNEEIQFALYKNGWSYHSTGLSCDLNTWNHVALVHSETDGNTTIYLNGGDAAGGSQVSFTSGYGYRSPITTSNHNLRIG